MQVEASHSWRRHDVTIDDGERMHVEQQVDPVRSQDVPEGRLGGGLR
jgi:hypothetical protein